MPRVTVRIPGPLRPFTRGLGAVVVDATTPAMALAALASQDRRIGSHLFADDGSLRGYVSLFLDGDALGDGGLNQTLEHDSDLTIVPSVAGG